DQLFELRASERSVEVLGSRRVGRYEWEVELRLIGSRQLTLGSLGGLLETLESEAIGVEIDAGLLLGRFDHPVDDTLVEVFAAQERIAAGRQHFEYAIAHLHDGDIERASAEIVDRD